MEQHERKTMSVPEAGREYFDLGRNAHQFPESQE
jgi:hypothetical protein